MTEGIRLEQVEQRIAELAVRYRKTREEIGVELLRIHDERLYKDRDYSSFSRYLTENSTTLWGLSREECMRLALDAESLNGMREALREIGSANPTDLPSLETTRFLRRQLDTPEEMIDAWQHHQNSGRSAGRYSEGLKESIAESKGEPTVRDVLTPEDMAYIPSGKFDEFENWASETSKLVGPIHRMPPEDVADACEKLYPEKIERHIQWAEEIANWYAAYRDELISRQRAGIHAVK